MSTQSDAALRHAMNQATNLAFTPDEVDDIVTKLAANGYYVAPIIPAGVNPGARISDPETSKKAAGEIKLRAGTQRTILLQAFNADYFNGGNGLTDEEAMEHSEGVSAMSEYAKRCSELREAGWIEPVTLIGTSSPATRKGNSGQDRMVSQITELGRAALAGVKS